MLDLHCSRKTARLANVRQMFSKYIRLQCTTGGWLVVSRMFLFVHNRMQRNIHTIRFTNTLAIDTTRIACMVTHNDDAQLTRRQLIDVIRTAELVLYQMCEFARLRHYGAAQAGDAVTDVAAHVPAIASQTKRSVHTRTIIWGERTSGTLTSIPGQRRAALRAAADGLAAGSATFAPRAPVCCSSPVSSAAAISSGRSSGSSSRTPP